jgi:hypothetical protein
MIKLLEQTFEGKGEVKGYYFTQMSKENNFYIYKVVDGDKIHYEVFKRKITAICLDFKTRVFSEDDFKEIYPKAKDFGVWAWTFKTYPEAEAKIREI